MPKVSSATKNIDGEPMVHVPNFIYESAKSDLDYLVQHINAISNVDLNVIGMHVEIEDCDGERFDVSVKSTMNFGYDPRRSLDFEFDYFVDGDTIRFWNHSDIDTIATELQHRIRERQGIRR